MSIIAKTQVKTNFSLWIQSRKRDGETEYAQAPPHNEFVLNINSTEHQRKFKKKIEKNVIHNILAGFSESSFRQIVMILNDIHQNDRWWIQPQITTCR